MSKEIPLNIVLENDPQQIVFAGANAAPITLTLKNEDTRNAASVLINAVRGDLLKKNDLTLTPEELTGGGYKVVDEKWVECRFGTPDPWQSVDEWATPFDLGPLAAGASVGFELRVNVPPASADVGRMCFAIMISASTGEDLRVVSVFIDQPEFALSVGDEATATATVAADSGADDSITWTSSNLSVANIENDGKITAIGAGVAIISARSLINPLAESTRFAIVSKPVIIAGAVAWFDASDLTTITESGGLVGEWRDKSGNDNHASQSDSGLKPATGTASLNGKNVISFNSSYLNGAAPLPIGKVNYTVFVVAKALTGGKSSFFHFGTNDGASTGTSFGVAADSSAPVNNQLGHFYPNQGEGCAFIFGAFHLITAQQSGDIRTTRLDEAEKTNATAASLNLTNSTMRIGNRYLDPTSWAMEGEIAEIIVYDTALTPAEIAVNEEYLKAKWGL